MIQVKRFSPLGNFLALLPDEVEEEQSTLELPDTAKRKELPRTGAVIAVGPACTRAKAGLRYLYSPYAGTKIVLNGVEHIYMQDDQIIGEID